MNAQSRRTGSVVRLEPSQLPGGGQGVLFDVVNEPAALAKLYKVSGKEEVELRSLTATEVRKLTAMIDHPPRQLRDANDHILIAWPTDVLESTGPSRQVIGFVMPKAVGVSELLAVSNATLRRRLSQEFGSRVDHRFLVRTGRNLAASFASVHAGGHVVGDVKHQNALVDNRAVVTLVDADSFQFRDPATREVFQCPVATDEYCPPESQLSSSALQESHDLFGLGVLLFHLLIGTHPFNGSGMGGEFNWRERIAGGHFAYCRRRRPLVKAHSTLPSIRMLPPEVAELFFECFEEGHDRPERRPTASVWMKALEAYETALVPCRRNQRHMFGSHLAVCPWCELFARVGTDLFPPLATPRARGAQGTTAPSPPGPRSNRAPSGPARPVPLTQTPPTPANAPQSPRVSVVALALVGLFLMFALLRNAFTAVSPVEPVPGQVLFTSPYPVSVFIDGVKRGQGTRLTLPMKAGDHTIELLADRVFLSATSTLVVEAGKDVQIAAPLLVETTIRTVPSGAPVRLRGRLLGSAPVAVSAVADRYSVSIGWPTSIKPFEVTLDLRPGMGDVTIQAPPGLLSGELPPGSEAGAVAAGGETPAAEGVGPGEPRTHASVGELSGSPVAEKEVGSLPGGAGPPAMPGTGLKTEAGPPGDARPLSEPRAAMLERLAVETRARWSEATKIIDAADDDAYLRAAEQLRAAIGEIATFERAHGAGSETRQLMQATSQRLREEVMDACTAENRANIAGRRRATIPCPQ